MVCGSQVRIIGCCFYHFSQVEEEDNLPIKLLKNFDGTQDEDCTGKILTAACIEEIEVR